MDSAFKNKVVLVTGGARGIGCATATAFAREGACVVIADREQPAGSAVAAALRDEGCDSLFLAADVTDGAQVAAMIADTVAHFGRLDIAFNNAGVAAQGALLTDIDEAEFDRVIAINLKSIWLCMKYQIPAMLASGGGAIVNGCSVLGLVGTAYGAPYVAAKHGVAGLTKTAALEYAQQGIRVNAVCPGSVRTDLLRDALADPAIEAQLIAGHPIGRLAEPGDISGAVLWLASAQAAFVTGAMIPVDGGWTAQ